MKKIFFVLAFLISLLNGFSQSIVEIRGDSIRMSKTGGNAELILLNSTRDSLHGLLTNTGLGRTKFIRTKTINDSTIIIGLDTFILRGGVGHSGNVGTVTSVAAADLVPLFTSVVNTSTSTPSIVYTLSSAPANSVYGRNGSSAGAPNFYTPLLASSVFSNQGTTTTVLHGNAAGDPSWGAVNLATDVTGLLPNANLANSTLGFTVPGITGLAPNWAASSVALGNNVVLNIPYAGSAGVTMGLVSKVDYDAWYASAAGFPNVPANTIIGRILPGTGPASALTGTQATTLLSVFTSTDHGVAPQSGGGTTNFLRADGVWAPPPGGSGTLNTVLGAGFRTLSLGTQDHRSYFNGYGILIDSTSNANGLTWKADTSQIATLRAVRDTMRLVMNNVSMVSRIEFIHSGASSATYQDDDLIGRQITALSIENFNIGFLARTGKVYASFDAVTGTITLTNGQFAADDMVIILYRNTPIFLLDGNGNPVRDGNGNFIILN